MSGYRRGGRLHRRRQTGNMCLFFCVSVGIPSFLSRVPPRALHDRIDVNSELIVFFRSPFKLDFAKRPSYGQSSIRRSTIVIALNLSGHSKMGSFLMIVVKLYSHTVRMIEIAHFSVHTVLMNEMPRFFIIRKYDWFCSQTTSQIRIRSKSF